MLTVPVFFCHLHDGVSSNKAFVRICYGNISKNTKTAIKMRFHYRIIESCRVLYSRKKLDGLDPFVRCGFTCLQWAVGSEWGTCRVLSSALCSPAVPHSCTSWQVGLQTNVYYIWKKKWRLPYQYKTSSPHSTSNRKWEKATGAESPSRANKYQALSSFISSLFSLSFHPHSLCSYLQQHQKQRVRQATFQAQGCYVTARRVVPIYRKS